MQNSYSLRAQFEIVKGVVDKEMNAVVVGRRPLSNNHGMVLYFRSNTAWRDHLRVVVQVPAKAGGVIAIPHTAWSVLAQGIGLFYERLLVKDNNRTIYLYCPLCHGSSPLALYFNLFDVPDVGYRLELEELTCGKYSLKDVPSWGMGLIKREPCEFRVNMNIFAALNYNESLNSREFLPIHEFSHVAGLADKLMFWHDFLMAVKRLAVIDYWSKP